MRKEISMAKKSMKKPIRKPTKKSSAKVAKKIKQSRKPVKKSIKKKVFRRPRKPAVLKATTFMSEVAHDINKVEVPAALPAPTTLVEPTPVPTPVSKEHNPAFPIWPDAECSECGYDASNDPNGENFLYKLTCPDCAKEGCDACMPAGRGCPCPECAEKPENKYNEDPSSCHD